MIAGLDLTLEDAHKQNDTLVVVVPRVDQKKSQRFVLVSYRSRDVLDDAGKQCLDIDTRLGRHQHSFFWVQFEGISDLFECARRVGRRQVNLVDDGY